MSYPNQKIIYCVPEERKKNERYGSLSRKAEIVSARLLNDGSASHIVYLHFALHKKDHKFELSKQELENCLGISTKQYRKAITMLEKAGYLTRSKPNSNIYFFKRIPDRYKDMDILDILAEQHTPTSNSTVPCEDKNIPLQSKDIALEVDRNKTNTTDKTVIENVSNDTFIVDLPKTENGNTDTVFDNEEKQHSFHISDIGYKYRRKYKSLMQAAQWSKMADGIKIEAILNKYLSTHKESAELKRLGDKYGRFVKGWDNKSGIPIIVYGTSFLAKEQMKHNIENVPKEYYERKEQ